MPRRDVDDERLLRLRRWVIRRHDKLIGEFDLWRHMP